MWRGQPVAGPDAEEDGGRLADPAFVPWSEGGDPSGRGPRPLWGAPAPPSHDRPSPPEWEPEPTAAPVRAPAPVPAEPFTVEEDRRGPVMHWIPPEGGAPIGRGGG
jgi:hypothetical protein